MTPKKNKCQAKTARGKRCSFYALEGHLVCKVHLGHRKPDGEDGPDDELKTSIIDAIRAGAIMHVAALANGVSIAAADGWYERNANSFADAVDRASAELELKCLQSISTAASRDWRAAVWVLDHTGGGGPAGGSSSPTEGPPSNGPGGGYGTSAASSEFDDDQVDKDGKRL